MSVHLLSTELARWDEVEGGALLLTFFTDERPLRGAAGLADWRLCGRLSKLIKRGKVTGEAGESLLFPPGRRLPFTHVFLFGLGSSKEFNDDIYRERVRWICDVAVRANIKNYAIQPPGRASGLIGARRALELWLEETGADSGPPEVAIIDNHGGQKDMAELLRYQRRKK